MKPLIVVTADVIDSRSHPEVADVLRRKMQQWMQPGLLTPFSLAVGDELQAVCEWSEALPALIRRLRWKCHPFQIRVGIGFGTVDDWRPDAASWEMNGSAFYHARDALEAISQSKQPLTRVGAGDEGFALVLNTIYPLIDLLMSRWTFEQWEAIAAYEELQTYEKAAGRLGITRQNVQKRCYAASWDLVQATEERLGRLIVMHRPTYNAP